jgi:signal transduction histidine kinase
VRNLAPGYHRVQLNGSFELVHVSDGPPGRLFLVFNQEQVGRLAFLFGFLPLILVLLIIYITTWLTYRASRRALSPVIALAKAVREWDPKRPDLAALEPRNLSADPDGDVETLARALHGYASRIEEFVERERNFTRDASHELRSPLTVIKLAGDVLVEEDVSPFAQRALQRIRRSVRDMEAMLETFLLLARESDTGLPQEEFVVNDAVREEVERAQPLLEGKPVTLELEQRARFALRAPPRVFAAMIGNLIRNACLYTERGSIVVGVREGSVRVSDTGCGMDAEELARAFQPFYRGSDSGARGHGIGLAVVRRIADRFDWPVELESRPGHGTVATLRFPKAMPVDAALP